MATDSPHDPPFRADHVGSLLRPRELLKARGDRASGKISAEELRAVEDASIRDVIAFPKNQVARDLMMDAPSAVPENLVRELYLQSTAPKPP